MADHETGEIMFDLSSANIETTVGDTPCDKRRRVDLTISTLSTMVQVRLAPEQALEIAEAIYRHLLDRDDSARADAIYSLESLRADRPEVPR